MLRLQQDFALKSVHHWRAGDELIFLDETSCHPWNKFVKMWMKVKEPYFNKVASLRGSGVAVLGAISSKRPDLKYVVSPDGNNGATFRLLIEEIKTWPRIPGSKSIVVMDNATYHKGAVRDLFMEHGFSLMFLPSSSSELNPIEHVWGIFKYRLTKKLTSKTHRELQELTKPRKDQDGNKIPNHFYHLIVAEMLTFAADPNLDFDHIATSQFKQMLKVINGTTV
jgi:transposase